MPKKKKNETLSAIEETQSLLRDNIEQSKALIQKSEELLEKHRKELKGAAEA